MQSPNIALAIEMYYNKLEIGTADICTLFSCSRSIGLKFKNTARAEMAKQGKRPFIAHHVSTKIAYQQWGLDIADLEERHKKLQKLNGGTPHDRP